MKSKVLIAIFSTFAVAMWSLPANAAAGAVYTLTNSSTGNAVMMFNRSADGHLSLGGTFSTGGMGTGVGLGTQGAVVLDASNRFLFAVNAASNTISTFSVAYNGLTLVGTTSSYGLNPVSLTSFGNMLYVLNAAGEVGNSDNIAGFTVDANGNLHNITYGVPLSAPSVGPAEISFNPEGNLLVVTEKATNNIDVFTLDSMGNITGMKVMMSAAETPYGFAFGKRDTLIVSDAVGGTANAGAVSSYFLAEDESHHTVTGSAGDHQSAPCWIAVTNDGLYAYITNTGSGTVSSYSVGYAGALMLMNQSAANVGSSSAPVDMAISNNSRSLYVLGPGTGVVKGYSINIDGSLSLETTMSSLPASASGLAAR
jgi:6-phosphogluconolactonase